MKKNFSKIVEERRSYYKSIVSVFCPILEETIYFTAEGFNHLLFKSNRTPRNLSERYMKLMCLEFASVVIEKCEIVNETRKNTRTIKGKRKSVISHELVFEVVKNKEIRVVVDKIGTGKLKFRSIMPHNNKSKPKPKKRP
jgi:hypothetical protein